MNGVEHYAEAERLLRRADTMREQGLPGDHVDDIVATAHVHATLALAAATALATTNRYVGDSREITDWAHIAQPDAMAKPACPEGCERKDGCLPRCIDAQLAKPAPIDEEPPF